MKITTSDILNTLKYIAIAVVVLLIGTQGLLNSIPYNEVFANVNYYSDQATQSILSRISVQLPGSTGSGANLSVQDLIISSLISIVVNLVVVLTVAAIQIIFIFSVAMAIIGALILSQNRGIFETLFLVVGFAIPQPRKHWGSVYDIETNLPIPFAALRISGSSADNTPLTVTQGTTDLDGKYRIYLNDIPNKAALMVKAAGYRDKVVPITSTSHKEIILDVPMVKLEKDAKLPLLASVRNFVFKRADRLVTYLFILSLAGLVLSAVNAIAYQRQWGYIGMVIYGLSSSWNIYILNNRLRTNIGKVINAEDNKPLESAFVKLFYAGQPVISGITDKDGVVKLNVLAGTYDVEVTKLGYSLLDSAVIGNTRIAKAYVNEKGYFTKNLRMGTADAVTTPPPIQDSDKLMNPFA